MMNSTPPDPVDAISVDDALALVRGGSPEGWAVLRRVCGGFFRERAGANMLDSLLEDVWMALENHPSEISGDNKKFYELLGRVVDDVMGWYLLESHLAGNRLAFERIQKLFERCLLGIARGILGPAHPEVRDVVQDVWLKVLQKPPERLPPLECKSSTPLSAYLREMTRNGAKSRLRGRKFDDLDGIGAAEDFPQLPRHTEEAIRIVSELRPRHHTIAYILNKWLGKKPSEIVAIYGVRPLAEIVRGLPSDLGSSDRTHAMSDAQWWHVLKPLRRDMELTVGTTVPDPEMLAGTCIDPNRQTGTTAMAEYWVATEARMQSRTVAHWVNATHKRFQAEVDQQEEKALCCLCSHAGDPHESISFGFLRTLRTCEEEFVQQSNTQMNELVHSWEAHYCEAATVRKVLATAKVKSCFDRLRGRLSRMLSLYISDPERRKRCTARGARVAADTVLNDYYSGTSHEERIGDLRRWCLRARSGLIECLKAQGGGFLFAHMMEWV